jgi:CRISPR-associated protein Cmr6
MAQNTRNCLKTVRRTDTTHTALWLDRYMPDHQTGTGQQLVEDAARIPTPEAYSRFFERWQRTLHDACTAAPKKATVQGRLSVGLGGESVLETAITLHRTYGVPYIPGSALKGLAANYARNRLEAETWGAESDAYRIMFGDTTAAGYLTFFDALYVPGSGHQRKALWPDVITVHHPDYYQGNKPPADWDSPTPVSFLSATGDYLIAIGGDQRWADKALEILGMALQEEGIGAKTSSGYGRMKLEGAQMPDLTKRTPTVSSVAAPAVPLPVRRGVIIEIQPPKRFGRLRDNESGTEYRFSTEVIEGNFPARRATVEFSLRDDQVVKVKRA